MTSRLARLCARSPKALLGALGALTVVLGIYAAGVPERLAPSGGALGGSPSASAAADLAAELGFHPEPALLLVASGAEPLSTPANDVALRTFKGQVESVAGVAAVRESARSGDGRSVLVAVHPEADLDDGAVTAIAEGIGELDPGILQVLVGGSHPTAVGARDVLGAEAPALALLALPLLALVLAASLGVRLGAAALLGALLAAAAAVTVVGVLGTVFDLVAVGTVAAALLALLAATESASALVVRYREEAATLGAGADALEYSLGLLTRGLLVGGGSAAFVGVALLAVPMDLVRSTGAALVVAALLGPLLGLLPAAATLALRGREEVGEALPLVRDGEPLESGPRSYRALLVLAGERRRGLVAILPAILVLAAALPLLDAEAIGFDAAELPDDEPAAVAEAQIAGAFGPGASGSLIVAVEGQPEAPTVTIYRDAISRLEGVGIVARGVAAGERAFFEVAPDARPRSRGAQEIADAVAAVPAPVSRRITGPAAELRDAGAGLASDLPLAVAVALLGAAALWSALFRSGFGLLLALASLTAPLVGLAVLHLVFSEGRLADPLGYEPAGAPHLATYVLVCAVLLALALFRGAQTAAALREERALGGGAAGSLARAGLLTLRPAAIATAAGVVVAGVWLAAPLLPAQEVAVGLCAGLLADLLVARLLIAPGFARLSLGQTR